MTTLISVVVRTLNEERWLEPLLKAVRSQSIANTQVIVVDSGSVDDTVEIAKRYADSVIAIETDSFSYGYALNRGAAVAEASLIAIVSAHTEPEHDRWLQNLSSPFGEVPEASGLALTYGKQRGNHITKLSEHTDFRRQFPGLSRRQRGPDYFCNNANALIRRDLWQRHPFDETLPGLEDMAWAKRWMDQGLEIQYVADAGVFHIHEETWPQIYRRFRRESIAARITKVSRQSTSRLVASEVQSLGGDVVAAIARRRLDEIRQAVLYRYWKTRGIVHGRRAADDPTFGAGLEEHGGAYRALEVQEPGHARLVLHGFPALRPNEVMIRVSHVGICQTDLEVLRCTLGYFRDGTARLPVVPGHEYSGVIVKKGANVESLTIGDAVVGECILSCGVCAECLANRQTACRQRREVGVVNYNGACAEYLILPSRFAHRLPEGVSLLSACTVEPLAVAIKGIRRLGLTYASEMGRSRVLVFGAGALGNLCSQVVSHFGHRVTCVDRLQSRLDHLTNIVESTTMSVPPLQKFEYVIEATGSIELAELMIRDSPSGCNLLLLGLPYGQLQWNLEELVAHEKRIIGSVGSNYETFEAAIRMLPELDLVPFNQSVLDLDDWDRAYRIHESKEHLKVKLRLTRGDGPPALLASQRTFVSEGPPV